MWTKNSDVLVDTLIIFMVSISYTDMSPLSHFLIIEFNGSEGTCTGMVQLCAIILYSVSINPKVYIISIEYNCNNY